MQITAYLEPSLGTSTSLPLNEQEVISMNTQNLIKIAKKALRFLTTLLAVGVLQISSACYPITQQVVSSNSVMPTSTLPPFTEMPLISVTSTATPEPKNKLNRLCYGESMELRDTSNLTGSLIYNIKDKAFALDISSQKTKELKNISGIIATISPNRDKIADLQPYNPNDPLSKEKIKIVIDSQTQQLIFPVQQDLYLGNFLEDGRLVLGSPKALENNWTKEGSTDQLYILSLDTGEVTPKTIFLPLYDRYETISYTQYSPNWKYVIYPYLPPAGTGDENSILLNIETENILKFKVPHHDKYGPFPTWRPDSQSITFIRPSLANQKDNFFNIDLDGKIVQLTNIEEVIKDKYSLPETPTWSPNGQYLAFEIYLTVPDSEILFILDTQTGILTDTCLNVSRLSEMAWSPSSEDLAIFNYGATKIQIVDLKSQKGYEVDIKTDPAYFSSLIGWVNWDTP